MTRNLAIIDKAIVVPPHGADSCFHGGRLRHRFVRPPLKAKVMRASQPYWIQEMFAPVSPQGRKREIDSRAVLIRIVGGQNVADSVNLNPAPPRAYRHE